MTTPSANALALPTETRDRAFTTLVDQVNQGHDAAAPQLLALCTTYPELWQRFTRIERQATDSWLQLLAPGSDPQPTVLRTTIRQDLEQQRIALQQAGDSPLEQLLIGRILSSWLQVQYTEGQYIHLLSAPQTTAAVREHWQKALERAQRQVLRAIRELATTRRLLKPTTVNIAQNQINITS